MSANLSINRNKSNQDPNELPPKKVTTTSIDHDHISETVAKKTENQKIEPNTLAYLPKITTKTESPIKNNETILLNHDFEKIIENIIKKENNKDFESLKIDLAKEIFTKLKKLNIKIEQEEWDTFLIELTIFLSSKFDQICTDLIKQTIQKLENYLKKEDQTNKKS